MSKYDEPQKSVSEPIKPFEIVTTSRGVKSIRDLRVGEILHNPLGPWPEAQALYVKQAQLAETLTNKAFKDLPLCIFDIGLGAATNALAAIDTYLNLALSAQKSYLRPLRIYSFENDLGLLAFALKNAEVFEHTWRFKRYMTSLLETGEVKEEGFHWSLHEGDFLDEFAKIKAKGEIIYHDPYSSQKLPRLWSVSCFQKIKANTIASPPFSKLLTYSRSTPVRVGLLLAGFFVGRGIGFDPSSESTVAATDKALLRDPLDSRWLDSWERSQKQLPIESDTPTPLSLAEVSLILKTHPQFQT